MTMMNWEVWGPLLRYKQKQYIYVYLCELPHPIPNVLLNLLKSGFSYHFMKLLFLKSTWHFPSLLPQTTDTFQVFFWFLRSIKLCWPFQSFLKSCPLSSKTCSLFSLNSPALPPWPALWATFPLCVPGTVMFPDSYPGSSLLLPVYAHFLGYLIHFYDLNYHLMLMASKSFYLTPFYHIWLPSEHSPGGATGSSYSTWPPVESIAILVPVLLLGYLSTDIPMAQTETWGHALPLSLSLSISSTQSPQCLSDLYSISSAPSLLATIKASGFLLIN